MYKINNNFNKSHLINVTVIVQLKAAPLSLEVVEEASIGHIWHHYGNAGASIKTHPNQGHDVRMVKVLHLVHLTHHALNIRQREQTCRVDNHKCNDVCVVLLSVGQKLQG